MEITKKHIALVIILILISTLSGLFILYLEDKSSDRPKFKILYENDPLLINPYGVILVNPDLHPEVDIQKASVFVKWLISDEGQNAIKNYELHGEQLFTPNFNWTALPESDQQYWSSIDLEDDNSDGNIRMATTTSADDSGLLDYLLAIFYKTSDIRIEVIAVGTGAALENGRQGNVDFVIVHARELEDQFVNDGYGIHRVDLMYNDFVIIGPETDPASISNLTSVEVVLQKIYSSKNEFISRGDNSGTHNKELSIWAETDISINTGDQDWVDGNSWYTESGTGMSATILIAYEKEAYTITDRATWINISINSNLA
ncbi:MAG: substrate-binding domain-containing protein [Candidatus Kariarchaeaceae archaeon]